MFDWSNPEPGLYILHFSGDLSEQEQESFLSLLDRLSALSTPYAALMTSEGNSPLSPDNKKRMNAWFKQNREHMATWCHGHVRVQPGFTEDHYEGSNLAKALPFPLKAASTYEEGLVLARTLLQRQTKEIQGA